MDFTLLQLAFPQRSSRSISGPNRSSRHAADELNLRALLISDGRSMLDASAVLVKGKWATGVGVLAFALSSGLAAAQTPTPDPAPVPPPPAPVVEPPPAPEAERAPAPPPIRVPRPEKKRPEGPLALRMARLHQPLAEMGPYAQNKGTKTARLAPLSNVRSTGSGSSDSLPVGLVLLLALAGLIGAAVVVLIAVPGRLMSGASSQLADRRGELAVGGLACFSGLAIGVLISLLLQ
jgi:hypothetical protein